MIPVLWILGGIAAWGLWHKKQAAATATTPTSNAKTPGLFSPGLLAQLQGKPGQPTAAKAAVQGDLMARCNDPRKLQQAAAFFGQDGLPEYAAPLLQKAALIHEMMHGARDIVERSRAGDQHAMAIAKGIGDQARAGNKRAQLSWVLIEHYTKTHPLAEKPAEQAA